MNQKKPDPVRVLDVITSCKDIEQLKVARTYAKLWLKKHIKWWHTDTALLPGVFFEFIKDKWKLIHLENGTWACCSQCGEVGSLTIIEKPNEPPKRLCARCVERVK